MRIGAKKRPFYRVVVVNERSKRNGEYLELLGTYNPLTEPKEILLKKDRIDYWIKQGAILSDGYLRITKQAPQKPPRKPKKERQPSVVSPQPTSPELQRGEPSDKKPEVEIKEEVATKDKTEDIEAPDTEQQTTN